MYTVLVGDLNLDSPAYQKLVESLIAALKARYSDLVIISAACENGIGKFVRDRCISNKSNADVSFVEISLHVWARLERSKLAQVYMGRNASLLELGDEFYIISNGKRTGHIADLITRVRGGKAPLALFSSTSLSEKVQYFNGMQPLDNECSVRDAMQSSSIKGLLE